MESKILSLFPLQLVVFEGEELRLHIFEPRYKKLILDSIDEDTEFGISAIVGNDISEFGCAVKVLRIESKYPGGEMDIVCKGSNRYNLLEYYPSKSSAEAASGLVEYLPFTFDEDKELNLRLTDLINELLRMNKTEIKSISNVNFNLNHWIHKLGLDIKKEIEMAALPSTFERQLYLLNHLKNLVSVQGEIHRMQQMIQLNGHFKRLDQSL